MAAPQKAHRAKIMDPLPFLFIAVLVFGSVQLGVYLMWRYAQSPKEIIGKNRVSIRKYIVDKKPKINRNK